MALIQANPKGAITLGDIEGNIKETGQTVPLCHNAWDIHAHRALGARAYPMSVCTMAMPVFLAAATPCMTPLMEP